MGKKQKKAEAETDAERVENDKAENELELDNGDSHKKKRRKKNKERNEIDREVIEAKEIPTVSVAISGSIINNAQSLELATRVLHPLYLVFLFFKRNYSRVISYSVVVFFYYVIFNILVFFVVVFDFLLTFFSWPVKLLVPRLFFELMRFPSLFSLLISIIIEK